MGCGHSLAAAQGFPHGPQRVEGKAKMECADALTRYENVLRAECAQEEATVKSTREVFCRSLENAIQQIHARQRSAAVALDADEMSKVTALTRELDSLRAMQGATGSNVLGTWKMLEKAGVVNRFFRRVYAQMAEENPDIKVIFNAVEPTEQAKVLGRMFSTVVYVYGKPEVLQKMLLSVGARHRAYGVTYEHLELMKKAFFHVLPSFLDQQILESCQNDWLQLWSIMMETIERGFRSSEGEQFAHIRERAMVRQLQKDFALILERQKGLDTRRQIVSVMYGKAIQLDSNFKYFKALEDLRSAKRVLQALADVFASLNDLKKVREYCVELGARHLAYNVTPKHLQMFTRPFLYACRSFLEKEWDIVMQSRFSWVWNLIITNMIEGMERGPTGTMTVQAPNGLTPFCYLLTEVEGSTMLWTKNSDLMGRAILKHNAVIRSVIALYNAYEVKLVGSSFIIACSDIFVGTKIALAIQLELMRTVPIASGFEMFDTVEGAGDPSCWQNKSLRVRVALQHCVDAIASYDNVHQRYDYYGSSINCCSGILGVTCGGQILMSKSSFAALQAMSEFYENPCPPDLQKVEIDHGSVEPLGLADWISVEDLGPAPLKEIPEPVHLVSITPRCLSGRKFITKWRKNMGADV